MLPGAESALKRQQKRDIFKDSALTVGNFSNFIVFLQNQTQQVETVNSAPRTTENVTHLKIARYIVFSIVSKAFATY